MMQGLQEYIAEAAGVPWVIGGDWNFEPESLEDRWGTIWEAQIADTMGPTKVRAQPRLAPRQQALVDKSDRY